MKLFHYFFSGLLLSSAIGLVNAAPFPDRPIKLIVPFTAGGNVDISARTIAQGLTEQLGQSIIVENKPGANTMIGTDFVAKSPADGYTLLAHSGWKAVMHLPREHWMQAPDRFCLQMWQVKLNLFLSMFWTP